MPTLESFTQDFRVHCEKDLRAHLETLGPMGRTEMYRSLDKYLLPSVLESYIPHYHPDLWEIFLSDKEGVLSKYPLQRRVNIPMRIMFLDTSAAHLIRVALLLHLNAEAHKIAYSLLPPLPPDQQP